jgi:hypothetical protein
LKKEFSYSILWLWIGDKVSWAGCTFEEVAEKTKYQKMNVNLFATKLGRIISPRGSLEATILYNDSQHSIPALQGRANKISLLCGYH